MSGNTSVVSSTPGFVTGTFGAKDVRLATMTNEAPGLFAAGDFAVSQRAAGANMSLDIADGRALISPAVSTHQGLYLVRKSAGTAYNTSVDGGYAWTAADPTNPRIDLLCVEIKDTAEDASGTTGYRFRIVDGTANAGATHQLATTYWPAVPTGCLPIAAIRVPALATTLTTANITNLNPIAGSRSAYNSSAAATTDTTTSATYTRLSTPDFVCVYLPHAYCRMRLAYKAQWKTSANSGTQGAAFFINDTQLKYDAGLGAAAAVAEFTITSTDIKYSILSTSVPAASTTYNSMQARTNGTADTTEVATGQVLYGSTGLGAPGAIDIYGTVAGWYVIEARFKTSANTLSVRNRLMWCEVIG